MAAQKVRYAGIDGRLTDLDSNAPADLMPWISDRWDTHFRWNGARIVGRTAKGRATIVALALNHSDQVDARVALIREGNMKTE